MSLRDRRWGDGFEKNLAAREIERVDNLKREAARIERGRERRANKVTAAILDKEAPIPKEQYEIINAHRQALEDVRAKLAHAQAIERERAYERNMQKRMMELPPEIGDWIKLKRKM